MNFFTILMTGYCLAFTQGNTLYVSFFRHVTCRMYEHVLRITCIISGQLQIETP